MRSACFVVATGGCEDGHEDAACDFGGELETVIVVFF